MPSDNKALQANLTRRESCDMRAADHEKLSSKALPTHSLNYTYGSLLLRKLSNVPLATDRGLFRLVADTKFRSSKTRRKISAKFDYISLHPLHLSSNHFNQTGSFFLLGNIRCKFISVSSYPLKIFCVL